MLARHGAAGPEPTLGDAMRQRMVVRIHKYEVHVCNVLGVPGGDFRLSGVRPEPHRYALPGPGLRSPASSRLPTAALPREQSALTLQQSVNAYCLLTAES